MVHGAWCMVYGVVEAMAPGGHLEGRLVGAEDDGVPEHDVILPGGPGHPGGGVLLGGNFGYF